MHFSYKIKVLFLSIGIGGCVILASCSRTLGQGRGYFVSAEGSDENQGTIRSPFKTVQKCADIVQPGETCWIREGVYRETIQPAISGTETKPITFMAYKNEEVTISGAELVTQWTKDQDSIYRTEVSLPVDSYSDTDFFANQVFAQGKMMPEARFPNLGEKQDFLRPDLLGGGLKSIGGNLATIENEKIPTLSEGWNGAKIWANE